MSRLESPNGVRKSVRNKYAAKSTRVQALQTNGMTHRPSVLKEGYLHKPSFFRFVSKFVFYILHDDFLATAISSNIISCQIIFHIQ